MASSLLQQLLSLLLLLLPSPLRLREHLSGNHAVSANNFHPIFLVAGVSCSDLEARLTEEYRPSVPHCGAMKGKGWFGLWKNSSELLSRDYVQCFEEQMSLVYDPAINEYRNLAGVETRVPNFGSTRAFSHKNPLKSDWCLGKLRAALEDMGYRDGDTMFGAPYDFRYAPPSPGQTSEVYSRYFKELMELVEAASERTRKKAVILGHSFGGMVALEFVRVPGAGAQLRVRDGHPLRASDDAAGHASHVEELRERHRELPVAGRVRAPAGAARGHQGAELLRVRARHGALPRRRRLRRGRGALQETGRPQDGQLRGADGAHDVHQRGRQQDAAAAGVLGRRLRRGPGGGGVRGRRWQDQFDQRLGV
ncbi:Lecithin-cholesterol acyltransferase-like 1 [Zea mays]|uniref:Lecithin-cholesterol acyltransferase-like 1 n=1 Tax=Zea mays TaxID=4577 RepID=A0A1D6EM94_MAIZE|nr:Lecithin-cholesterol acyltransferase-like 1 [Zea mays]